MNHVTRQELNNSRPFDFQRTSSREEVWSYITLLYDALKQNQVKQREVDPEKVKQHLFAVTSDLFLAFWADPKKYLAISLSAGYYSTSSRYKPVKLGYKRLINVLGALEGAYLTRHEGYRNVEDGIGRRTRIRATQKLIDEMVGAGIRPSMFERPRDEEIIVLKDEKKQEVDYTDNADTQRMRMNVNVINGALANTEIELVMTWDDYAQLIADLRDKSIKETMDCTLDMTKKKLRRIFNNNSFEQGGRFYGGWWQGLPKKWRSYIDIDGMASVEADYSSIHIQMMYAEKGVSIPKDFDAYQVKGIDRAFRPLLKVILQTIVNAESRAQAVASIRESTKDHPLPQGMNIDEVIQRFVDKHASIRDYFYSGEGVRFQYEDSRLAEKVLLKLIEQKSIALPVHDSFIIGHRWVPQLRQIMEQAFEELYDTKIKVKLDIEPDPSGRGLIKDKQYQLGGGDAQARFLARQEFGAFFQDRERLRIGIDTLRPHLSE